MYLHTEWNADDMHLVIHCFWLTNHKTCDTVKWICDMFSVFTQCLFRYHCSGLWRYVALSVVAIVSDGHAASIFRVKVRWVRCKCDRLHNQCPSKILVSTDRTVCCLNGVDWCLKWYPVAVISCVINSHVLSCGWMSAGGCFISWTRKILTINKKISRYITPSCSVSVCRLITVLAELKCVWVSFRSVLCTVCNCLCGFTIVGPS